MNYIDTSADTLISDDLQEKNIITASRQRCIHLLQCGTLLAAVAVLSLTAATDAHAAAISPGNVSYVYSGLHQPRGDLNPNYADASGDDLADGNIVADGTSVAAPWTGWVGFHEAPSSGDDGLPQPRIEFDLGGTYNLSSMSVNYLAGGGGFAKIFGPASVDIRYSTDNGATYSLLADETYSAFDLDGSLPVTVAREDSISLSGLGVTNVRIDFFQSADRWVFLQEVTFNGEIPPIVPEPSTYVMFAMGLLGLGILMRCRRRKAAPAY